MRGDESTIFLYSKFQIPDSKFYFMNKIAIIKTGGKQYKVKEGQVLSVEKLDLAAGETVKLETLLIADEDGGNLQIGQPSLGEVVEAKAGVTAQGDKVHVIKFKNKTRYKRNVGHRQIHTEIAIAKIA